MRGLRIAALAAVALGFAAAASALVTVPPLRARVTDLTRTLSDSERAELERKLAGFEARKGSQVAVLIVPTTQPEAIEQYGIRVVEAWKLGRAGVDDGALLLVAKDDRRLRIEVGYGLEGALSDAIANRIIDEQIVPRFRNGDFAGGIAAGVDAMLGVIEGEPLPAPAARGAPRALPGSLEQLLTVGFVAVFFVGAALRAAIGRLPAALVVGAALGAIAWLLALGLLAAIAIALVAFVLSLFAGLAHPGLRGPGRHYGGWGGGWSGGGGFGGGWSGGGGGFGGGGASGRW